MKKSKEKGIVHDYVFNLPTGAKLTIPSASGSKAESIFKKWKKEHG